MSDVAEPEVRVIDFEQFWRWIQGHPNCILRVANATMILFDDSEYHWHFGVESETTYFVQVIHGKRYVGELVINPTEVAFVHIQVGEQDEFAFDLLDQQHQFLSQFVMSHDYEDEQPVPPGRLTH
jgi:hypothetical protein